MYKFWNFFKILQDNLNFKFFFFVKSSIFGFFYIFSLFLHYTTKFFKKDSKIINCIWKINENRTLFHIFLEFDANRKKIKDFRKIIDDNFSAQDVHKIVQGKFQSVNFLSILWFKRMNINEYNSIMNATNFYYDIKILQNIPNFEEFIKFFSTQNYSKEEIREFFYANINIFVNGDENSKIYEKYARLLLTQEDFKAIKDEETLRNSLFVEGFL